MSEAGSGDEKDQKDNKSEEPSGSGEKKESKDKKGKDKKDDQGKEEDEKDGDEGEKEEEKKPKGPPIYKRPAFIIAAVLFLLLVIIGGIYLWYYYRHFVSTTDAYIDGHVMQVAPQVGARVAVLHVDDNLFVHKGQLLVELDPTDYQVALQQAQAQLDSAQGRLAQAQAQIDSAKASVAEAQATVDAAQVQLDNASRDLERYQTVDAGARTRQQLDNALTAQKNAQAQLAQAKARKTSADVSVATSIASAQAAEGDVKTAEANIKRAQVDLGYCKVYAPEDGRVTERTVEVGNYVPLGTTMFMLVSPDVWVTANFKETKLTHMQPGQPVTVKVDAFPYMKLQGRVDSIQAGSGARFSVLPAENATGNFVKIVQRVPVKIRLELGSNTNDAGLLSPGLSVEPRVRIR